MSVLFIRRHLRWLLSLYPPGPAAPSDFVQRSKWAIRPYWLLQENNHRELSSMLVEWTQVHWLVSLSVFLSRILKPSQQKTLQPIVFSNMFNCLNFFNPNCSRNFFIQNLCSHLLFSELASWKLNSNKSSRLNEFVEISFQRFFHNGFVYRKIIIQIIWWERQIDDVNINNVHFPLFNSYLVYQKNHWEGGYNAHYSLRPAWRVALNIFPMKLEVTNNLFCRDSQLSPCWTSSTWKSSSGPQTSCRSDRSGRSNDKQTKRAVGANHFNNEKRFWWLTGRDRQWKPQLRRGQSVHRCCWSLTPVGSMYREWMVVDPIQDGGSRVIEESSCTKDTFTNWKLPWSPFTPIGSRTIITSFNDVATFRTSFQLQIIIHIGALFSFRWIIKIASSLCSFNSPFKYLSMQQNIQGSRIEWDD